MSAQLVSILVMFVSGIAVGAVIDGTRTIVGQVPHIIFRKMVVLIEWCVWLFLAISTFYLLFLIKGGHWRFVDPAAQLLGIISYELFFQNITRFIGRLIVNIIIKPIYYIGHMFVALIRKIIKLIVKLLVLLTNPIFKVFEKYLIKNFKSK